MRKAYSYIRFSSKKQAAGDSLSRQKDMALAYATANNLELDTTLNFSDLGVSGYTGANVSGGALGLFIRAVDTGLVPKGSVLLIENMDRLSRQVVSEALPVFMDLLKAGVDIVTLTDGKLFTKSDLDNPFGFMSSVFPMFRANEESKLKSERVKRALDRKRLDKLPVCFGNGPIWLKPKADKSGWDIMEPLAETVRWVYESYLSGIGVKTIAKLGNQQGRRFGKADNFQPSQVWRMLRNPAVIGTWELGERRNGKMVLTGETREHYYPAVISENDYYRVQDKLNINSFTPGRKDPSYKNLLQGFIRCGHCGSVMTRKIASAAKNERHEVATYTCGSRSAGKSKCPTIAAHRLEPVLLPFLYSMAPNQLMATDQAVAIESAINDAKAALAAVERKLDKLSNSLEDMLGIDEDLPTSIIAAMRKLDNQKIERVAELNALKAKRAGLSDNDLNEKFNDNDILKMITLNSIESAAIRYTEHSKLKAIYEAVFVWAEDVAAIRLNKTKVTAWVPISSRHFNGAPLKFDNKSEFMVVSEYPDTRKPDWYLNRPAIPAGFEVKAEDINESLAMNIPVLAATTKHLARYPEPKAVKNYELLRPAVPLRPKKVKAAIQP